MGRSTSAFTLVLAGGGARGYAHVGVLRALERRGLAPSGIVGVSMGAIVAATYALRDDWYEVLLEVDLATLPQPGAFRGAEGARPPMLRRALDYAQAAWSMVSGWGAPDEVAATGREAIAMLVGSSNLDDGRIPVVVCATDLRSGARVAFRDGPAADAVYASSALAGVLPPFNEGDRVLADGAYADIAPVDLARELGPEVVIAVNPGQVTGAGAITNGLQAVMRAFEICHHTHAHLRLEQADLILQPGFRRFIDVLDFASGRECVAAGMRAVRAQEPAIRALLRPAGEPDSRRLAQHEEAVPHRAHVVGEQAPEDGLEEDGVPMAGAQ